MATSFHLGFAFAIDGFTSTKQVTVVASVCLGIIICKVVYHLTGWTSHLLFKAYGTLGSKQRMEWNNRGFSTFHAVFVSVAAIYLLIFSGLFDDNVPGDLIINRTSTLSEAVLGFSIGYFLTDLSVILWHFPVLGGVEYVFHHCLSMLAIILAVTSGQSQFYIFMVLLSEATTPFVNLRLYLDTIGQKSSKLYVYNGIALFLGWLVARVFLFIYFFIHMSLHFDQVKQVFPLGFYSLLTIPPALGVMNLIWFWKIAKGLIKTVSKSRHCE
ncbi:PREDICTED: transmembrane protein 56-like [Tarenaya hassleriana]|uniref:transmembrane protein 56-like n=1 Tax=Tarenaya hassleriana TaxID=28532 RepID=UPI00053C1F45|nr:PREDICTED: transmembrane protein 56-like [Tarenaya hassleriana]